MQTMEITVTSTIAQVMPQLDQFSSRQAPFAIAKALTQTAGLVRDEIKTQTPVAFDRPNAFTRNAWAIQKADKQALTAFVFAKDKQARYLKFGVQGGGRRVKGFERKVDGQTDADQKAGADKLVPTRNIKLDASGGVSLATIKRITQQAQGKAGRYFIGKPQGAGQNAGRGWGIYERTNGGRKIRLLMAFAQPKAYKTRLDMAGIGKRVVQQQFVAQLQQAWAYAMRTAR